MSGVACLWGTHQRGWRIPGGVDFGPYILGWWLAEDSIYGEGRGGKPKVSSLMKHRLLQHYTPFSNTVYTGEKKQRLAQTAIFRQKHHNIFSHQELSLRKCIFCFPPSVTQKVCILPFFKRSCFVLDLAFKYPFLPLCFELIFNWTGPCKVACPQLFHLHGKMRQIKGMDG